MEIGPIAGIPPVTKPSSAVPDPSRVFAVEFRKPPSEGTPSREDMASGTEGEESEGAPSAEDQRAPEEIAVDSDQEDNRPSKVNFFA